MKKIFLIPLEISGVLLAIIIIGIAGAAFGIYQFNKKPKKVSNLKTSYVLTADELFDDFDKNETEAMAKYVDKVVEVSGTISEVDKNKEGNLALVLKAENAMIGGVNAAMGQTVDQDIKSGDQITLKCMCVGYNMEVILNNCLPVQ